MASSSREDVHGDAYGYQRRDRDVVDYETWSTPQAPGITLRGPPPSTLEADRYVACIGAAQTYGCFVSEPFPVLLGQRLGLPALNLGIGGAGPSFFLRRPDLLELANRARFVILQVMSGRSESNSLFESGGLEYLERRADGARVGALEGYRALLESEPRWWPPGLGRRTLRLLTAGLPGSRIRRVVAETRANWVRSYRELLAALRGPVVLLWFSKREPRYRERHDRVDNLFGDFPHLVNESMIDAVRPLARAYVECVTARGSPQPLVSRFTGEPITIDPGLARKGMTGYRRQAFNTYYPSPEMHEDAAGALEPACRRLLDETAG